MEENDFSRWYAVRVRPWTEASVATVARNKGYKEFLPAYKVRRRWSDRVRSLDLPLFPGYLFCRLGQQSWLPLLTITSVCGLVGIGKTPIAIDDAEISAIEATIRSGLLAEPCPFMRFGQLVRLEQGPLAGLEGYYIETRKQHRVIVSVTLLQRSVSIEIERDWVRPLKEIGPKTLPGNVPVAADITSTPTRLAFA